MVLGLQLNKQETLNTSMPTHREHRQEYKGAFIYPLYCFQYNGWLGSSSRILYYRYITISWHLYWLDRVLATFAYVEEIPLLFYIDGNCSICPSLREYEVR